MPTLIKTQSRTSTNFCRSSLSVLAVVFTTILGLALMKPPPASAHVVPLSVCQTSWRAAPVGQKWPVQQKCLAFVKAHRFHHLCGGPRPLIRRGVTVKHVVATGKQRLVLTRMLNVGYKMGAPYKVLVSMVAGATQESGAAELDGGHGTSAGPMQLINTHGLHSQRKDAEFSARWYLLQAINVNHHLPYLRVGELTQRVQRSGHPGAYDQWVRESHRTVKVFLGPCRPALRS